MSLRKLFGAFVASVVAFASLPSDAGFQVVITVTGAGAGSLTVDDNDANDTNTAIGEISFKQTVGGLDTIFDAAVSNQFSQDPLDDAYLTNAIDAKNTTGGLVNVLVQVMQTGYVHPLNGGLGYNLTSFAQGASAVGATLTSTFSGDPIGSTQNFTAAGTTVTEVYPSGVTPFDLGSEISFALGGGATTRGQLFTRVDATAVTPEPTSIALLAMGGLGLVGGAIRRRRASKNA